MPSLLHLARSFIVMSCQRLSIMDVPDYCTTVIIACDQRCPMMNSPRVCSTYSCQKWDSSITNVSAETSAIAINGGEQDGDVGFAAARLAQEARQAMSFGIRGVRDVTSEFEAAAKLLQPGQLVKDEYFTLFEAVGAIEVYPTLHHS